MIFTKNNDIHKVLWIKPNELGKEHIFNHHNKKIKFQIPTEINKHKILRFNGLGKILNNQKGDLFLDIRLAKGDDIHKDIWISDKFYGNGGIKKLLIENKLIFKRKVNISIPPKCDNLNIIKLEGIAKKSYYFYRHQILKKRIRGNLFIKPIIFPSSIEPKNIYYKNIATDDLALEGWIYNKIDELNQKLKLDRKNIQRINVEKIADLFNEYGLKSIFRLLVKHLNLRWTPIRLVPSSQITKPGLVEIVTSYTNGIPTNHRFKIFIQNRFLTNPFAITAILAHELCHIVYMKRYETDLYLIMKKNKHKNVQNFESEKIEKERTIDILIFLYKLGEFQLRVARDMKLTLGYFNQIFFEKLINIVSRDSSN